MSDKSAFLVQNFINGKFCDPAEGQFLDSENPALGQPWAKVANSTQKDVQLAVAAARNAFPKWAATPVAERSRILMKIAAEIEKQLDFLAEVESRDQGKPVSLAKMVDIPRAVYNFRIFASAILHHLEPSSVMDAAAAVNYVQREPVGVAALITPWNLPLYLLTFKIAPAIAYGNTCVCKPSEMTSATAYLMASLLNDAGLPPGVCNLVFGTGPCAGEALVTHPDVDLISFTGSTAVGTHIQQVTAESLKKLSLELGGKNAGIIHADADLDKVIPIVISAAFRNQGEICLCMSRLFVHRSIYSRFLEEFLKQTRALNVGDPTAPSTWMGALVSRLHWEKVDSYVQLAANDPSCTVHCGHGVDSLQLPDKCKEGHFLLPTVISGMSDDSRLMQEEIFGPVVCVTPFDFTEEVVERANSVRYGLAACVWGSDMSTLNRTAQGLKVGTVWVNCWMLRDLNMPFGGCKMSGMGREGTEDSRDFYTEKKTICLKL